MANLPLYRTSFRSNLIKYNFRLNVSSFGKYFSSKDTKDENNTNNKPKEFNETVNDDKGSEKKLDESVKTVTSSQDPAKIETKKKLFSLLSELKVAPSDPKFNLALAKPLKRLTKSERMEQLEKNKKSPEEEITSAAKAVASSVKGDPEKTLMELNKKLSALNLSQKSSDSDEETKIPDIGIDEKLQENLMSSVKDVASTVKSELTPSVKSKLTQRLLKLSVESKEKSQTKRSIGDTMKGLKLEKQTPDDSQKREKLKQMMEKSKDKKSFSTGHKIQTRVNIFQSAALDIFSLDMDKKEETKKTIWQSLEEKKLKLMTEFAPANAFEEMIMWTEQGKHWKFPIDNESDMGAEENVGFHEHVFLDQHLHGFPTRGPIRHFMELVVVGLSKNPYISVERKIENINWFRDYFKDKEDILREYGTLE